MQLDIRNLSLSYGEKSVIDNFSLDVCIDGITAFSGPSGCGKTSLLRCIIGLEKYRGSIAGIKQDEIAVLFQENRLFPWRTVLEHITDVLPKERRGEAEKYLEICELTDEKKSFPESLSGGMARRLALARALALGGKLYAFDEPFAAVDDDCALRILKRIKSLNVPTLLISHRDVVLDFCDKRCEFSGLPLKLEVLL